ncbi:MAG: translation initiation factor IF-3 [Candidatus Paceibacterota bacterium]
MARRDRTRVNERIRAKEVRLIKHDGENVGVVSREEALKRAEEAGLDLIEMAAKAKPPVVKIMDYGKYKYEQSKKESAARAKSSSTETKVIQVKVGTGKNDLELKARRASEWLEEGHRVKVELYLRGRAKYMEKDFLEERMDRVLKLITTEYKVATPPRKGPKGLYMIIEQD